LLKIRQEIDKTAAVKRNNKTKAEQTTTKQQGIGTSLPPVN